MIDYYDIDWDYECYGPVPCPHCGAEMDMDADMCDQCETEMGD